VTFGLAPPPPPHRSGPDRTLPRAPRALVAGAVASGAVAAWLIPGAPVGLGLFLVAVSVTVAVAVSRPRPITVEVVVYGGLGLALSAMSMVRSAEWIVGLAALGALGLASLVVAGGSTWDQVVRGPIAVLARVPTSVPFLWRGASLPTRWLGRLSPVLRGAALAALLVGVFGGLFVSADRAFARLASETFIPEWDLAMMPFRVLVFGVVVVVTASYAAAAPRFAVGTVWPSVGSVWQAAVAEERRAPRRVGRTEWAMALGALDLLFAAFVAVQIAVLFGGHDHVLRTAGLTYSEYARQGFFQLLAVGVLTLGVVAATLRWAARNGARDALLLRALLGIVCALTLVVLASALRRLGLYEEAFGFTRARVAAHGIILWLGAVLVLVMAAGLGGRGWWLPRATVGLTAVGLLAFAAVDPDGLVASRNVARYRETGKIDLMYLRTLSADAVPALTELPVEERACGLEVIRHELTRPEPWHSWNFGRHRARQVLREVPAEPCARQRPWIARGVG
jgi:Domain of unknown function (DUF4173)